VWAIIDVIEAGERQDVGGLTLAVNHEHPAVRWWAATGLGNAGDTSVIAKLNPLLDDPYHGVRVAAAQSLCQLGDVETGLPVLEAGIDHENTFVGMYAIRAIELLGEKARPAESTIRRAEQGRSDEIRRIAKRLSAKLSTAP
jgi:HEAT repeat protein